MRPPRVVALLFLSWLAAPAAAHPIPNMRFDRTVVVQLTATGLAVSYTLELNDWTMTLDGKEFLTPSEMGSVRTQREFAALYAERKARLLADNLRGTLDGRPLTFRTGPAVVTPDRDHVKIHFSFPCDWVLTPSPERHAVTFEDQNFEDRAGTITLTLAPPGPDVTVTKSADPADLHAKSPLDYRPGDEQRLRRASATFTTSGSPPAQVSVAPGEPATTPSPALWDDLRDRGLVAVFDSGLGLGVMLVLAAAFGMAHAFTPGHGKTMVAAYLVGERGTVTHAVVLGLVATAAHTGSVIGVAVVIDLVYGNDVPAEAQGWLMLAGGLLIAAVGLWLLLQRVRGRADHVHLFGGHHHDHDHAHGGHDHYHAPPTATSGFGWVRVVLLGLGGGIIPCWDAVLLLLVALSRGKVGLAVPLLVAFSAGLAAVLIGLGIGVVYANRAGGRRFGDRRWFRLLPVVTAAILVGLGLWFSRDGARLLTRVDALPESAATARP